MEPAAKGAAKRLIISLLTMAALGGCAVYEPRQGYQYGGPGYYDTYGPEIGIGAGFGFERERRDHDGRRGGHHDRDRGSDHERREGGDHEHGGGPGVSSGGRDR